MTQAISVTKFNNYVKSIFNSEELLHNVQIVGEVFGVSVSKTAIYFSIKDEESSLPCVCFDGEIFRGIREGDQVIVTGSPNYYTKSGRFNFIVSKIAQSGEGLLFARFLELKARLEKEGLFDAAAKKPLPQVIRRIGVVTSKDGAVIQDIKNVAWRRNPALDIVLFSTKVQGNGAENEIAQGIEFFSDYPGVDIVIVARGGGSLEDLAAYNTEVVARAAYACKKPLVSAVGHETDFTIIDFVSDLRAPTPSAAAELVTKDTGSLRQTFEKQISTLGRLLTTFVADKTLALSGSTNLCLQFMENTVQNKQRKFEKLLQNLSNRCEKFATAAENGLSLKLARLEKLNPLAILQLGYAKIEQNGANVGKLCQLDLKKPIDVNFVDGQITIVPQQ